MKTEKVVWWIAITCAVLLTPSWLNPKTVWVTEDGGQSIQGWGWQNVATLAGFVAVVALAAGRLARAYVVIAVLCAGLTVVAFGGAAAETARTWIELARIGANPTLYVSRGDIIVRPATGMDRTILIAMTGAMSSLVLLGAWLRPGDES